jgi:hypothetical protein
MKLGREVSRAELQSETALRIKAVVVIHPATHDTLSPVPYSPTSHVLDTHVMGLDQHLVSTCIFAELPRVALH